jgi:Tfp pilus assembly protein PilN
MLRLELDYGPRHWSSYRAGIAVLFAAFAVLLFTLGLHALTGAEIREQESAWRSSQSQDKPGSDNGSVERIERLRPELTRANEIVLQLAFPWEKLFDAIEVFDPAQVALLRIETDMSRHSFTLTAEAKSFNGMLAYMRNLGKQTNLSDVYLVNHQILEEQELKPVRFSISAVLRVENSVRE